MMMLLMTLVLAAQAAASSGPQDESKPPVFGREVEVVKVDVVVTDKSGKPVTGLKREDFTLADDGKPQAFESFDVVDLPEAAAVPAGPAPSPRPHVATNVVPKGLPGRSFVLVFDNVHMTPLNAQRAKAAVVSFLQNGVRTGDRVTLVATGGGAWWTTRIPEGRADLIAVLKNLDGQRPFEPARDRITDYEAMRINLHNDASIAARVERRFDTFGMKSRADSTAMRQKSQEQGAPGAIDLYVSSRAAETYLKVRSRTRTTLAVLERIFQSLNPGADRKAVILVCEGFVLDSSEGDFRRVTEAARRANAAVYFIDTRGLEALSSLYSAEFGTPVVSEYDVMSAIADTSADSEGSEALALETGGFSVRNTNDLAGGIEKVSLESRSYYLLGFTPSDLVRDGRYHKLQVKVRGRNLTVRGRRGYYAPADDAVTAKAPRRPSNVDHEMQEAIDSPFFFDEIPLRMTSYVLEERLLGRARVLVVAEVDVTKVEAVETEGRRTATLEMLLAVANRDSGEVARDDQRIELQLRPEAMRTGPAWYSIAREFGLGAGGHQAKIVVRDPVGRRVGTVSYDFEVDPLNTFRVSTPILTDTLQQLPEQGGAAPVPLARRSFGRDSTLYCRFDVYGAAREARAAMPRVSAGFTLRRKDGPVRSRSAPTAIEPTSLGALSRMLQIPLSGLAAGDYELVLSIKDEIGGTTREVVEPFRVS